MFYGMILLRAVELFGGKYPFTTIEQMEIRRDRRKDAKIHKMIAKRMKDRQWTEFNMEGTTTNSEKEPMGYSLKVERK